MNRAGFKDTWLSFNADLERQGKVPFHAGLTQNQRSMYTLGVVVMAFLFTTFLEVLTGPLILGLGLFIIWNPGNRITRLEKRVFWMTSLLILLLALLDKTAMYNLAGPFALIVLITGILIWRST